MDALVNVTEMTEMEVNDVTDDTLKVSFANEGGESVTEALLEKELAEKQGASGCTIVPKEVEEEE